MRISKLGFFSMMALLVYQNCSNFEVDENWAVYSYRQPPIFFYDVKLVSKTLDNLNRENYIMDIVISYVADPAAEIDYRVAFSTPMMTGICPIQSGKAKGNARHMRMSCLLPHSDALYIQLTLKSPTGEESIHQVAL